MKYTSRKKGLPAGETRAHRAAKKGEKKHGTT